MCIFESAIAVVFIFFNDTCTCTYVHSDLINSNTDELMTNFFTIWNKIKEIKSHKLKPFWNIIVKTLVCIIIQLLGFEEVDIIIL